MRYHKLKASDQAGMYIVESPLVSECDILKMANQLSRKRLSKGRALSSPTEVKTHLQTLMQGYEHEVFSVLLLDTKLKILDFVEVTQGTINQATVYPRELVKLALAHNAAAMVLTHNHPSGDPLPSNADIELTKRLAEALSLIDVRVIDHIVVGAKGTKSLAEMGVM